jgi:ParB family transcriptional regulator, chromosome partitioning protein
MAKPPINTAAATSLGNSINSIFGGASDDEHDYQVIDLDSIVIKPGQIRDEMEDEDHPLEDLGESMKRLGVLQNLVVRPLPGGRFELVAGERRYRAATAGGLKRVPVLVKELTDELAEEVQAAENIHRKNLTQIEVAKRVKRDLDNLNGDTAAVLKKYDKGASWLSKTLGILTLGPEAQKAVKENLTADLEVLNDLKQIEKRNPQAAAAAVDALRKDAGKGKAREIVKEVKDTVKPPKQERKPASEKKAGDGGTKATPKNTEHEQPGPVSVFGAGGAKDSAAEKSGMSGSDSNFSPEIAVEELSDSERKQLEKRLIVQFDEGRASENVAVDLIQGLRSGTFGIRDDSLLRLGAFLQGAHMIETKFDLVKCLELIKS